MERKKFFPYDVGENESAKYWLSILNKLKNRGVQDILILCTDSLTGIKEAIAGAFPQTEYQRCIVHQVRNTLKYVPEKDRKAFALALYQEKGLEALERVRQKWTPKYPEALRSREKNWDALSPSFKFSPDVRRGFESLLARHKT